MSKRSRGVHLSPRRTTIYLIIGLFVLVALLYIFSTKMKADSTSAAVPVVNNCSLTQRLKSGNLFVCPARGARFDVEVERPFPNSNLSAFPNGKDCANVNIQVLKRDGTFLENEELLIEKPASVNITGPKNTGTGMFKWCVTTTSPIQAKITMKIKSLPTVKKTITVNFNPKFKVQDVTDRNSFQFNIPINFTAQIDPAMVPGLKKKTLSFVYKRRVNKWGMWKNEIRKVDVKMDCTPDGRCSATIGGNNVTTNRIVSGKFTYTYSFTTEGGNSFQQTYNGTLKKVR